MDNTAADLPEGSVVADDHMAWIKTYPSATAQWRGTTGGYYHDASVQKELDEGAEVLREGY